MCGAISTIGMSRRQLCVNGVTIRRKRIEGMRCDITCREVVLLSETAAWGKGRLKRLRKSGISQRQTMSLELREARAHETWEEGTIAGVAVESVVGNGLGDSGTGVVCCHQRVT